MLQHKRTQETKAKASQIDHDKQIFYNKNINKAGKVKKLH